MRSTFKLSIALIVAFMSATQPTLAQSPSSLPLHPGDHLQIKIWADTAIAADLTVADNGSVILPRLGTLSVANVPASALGDSVRKAYATLLNPVAVEVTPLRRVSVVGDVRTPNVLYLETRATVRDAIATAGGVDDIGREDPVILIRNGQRLKLDNWQLRNDDDATIRSGDVIVVQRESWFKRNVFSVVSGLGLVASLLITATRR